VCDEGVNRFGCAGGVIAVVDGEVGLEGGIVRGKGITEVDVIVRLAVCPVDNGVGKLYQLGLLCATKFATLSRGVNNGARRNTISSSRKLRARTSSFRRFF
jgi:hypothetical protein